MSEPKVSIILPTWNGEKELRRLLPKLVAQELAGGFEILAIDSSSSDGTRAELERHGAAVLVIDQREFRHGATRNRCAARARGEHLVFLSQDVEPVSKDFLAQLTSAFDDPRTAGAFARVIPWPEDDPLTARTVLWLPEAGEQALTRDLEGRGGLQSLSAEERALFVRFNNVASAIRASVFRELPFPDWAFGEDFAWAARALTRGWRLRFVPSAVVWHAHRYDARKAFERYRVDAAFHRLVHGHRLRPTAYSALRGFAYEVLSDWRFIRGDRTRPGRAAACLRSPLLRGAQVLGQWVGSHGLFAGPAGDATGRLL